MERSDGESLPKRTLVGVNLLRLLSEEGHRVFSAALAREFAPRVGLKDAYVRESLHHLRRNGWIIPVRRGLYALSEGVPGATPAHEFEIAMTLVNPAAVSHWSALNHHGLTEQTPRTTFVLTTTDASVPVDRASADSGRAYRAAGSLFRFVQVKPERFFGIEKTWVGDAQVMLTDPERALLDALAMPRYCGGFAEALHAFEAMGDRLDVERICRYAVLLGAATAKRLGWTLEKQGRPFSQFEQLASLPIKGYRLLNPSGPKAGQYNRRWMLRENPPGAGGALKPLRSRIQEERTRTSAPWEVVERDYALSWVLAGICHTPRLSDSLVFKGGTALKKCYFDDYRFSEDLDFSGLPGVPRGDDMERLVRQACDSAAALASDYAAMEFYVERYTEKEPHPAGQEAFTVRARLPWHKNPSTRVKIEVTVDEPVIRRAERRIVRHGYGETLNARVLVYSLAEIVAEKMRASLQQSRRLQERGWIRGRARDYYDIWRILVAYRDAACFEDFADLLRRKCDARGVAYGGVEDFLQNPALDEAQRTWDGQLGNLTTNLPPFETVVRDLRQALPALVPPRT